MSRNKYVVTYCISKLAIAYILKSEFGDTYHASFCPTHMKKEYESSRDSEEFITQIMIKFFSRLGIQVEFVEL